MNKLQPDGIMAYPSVVPADYFLIINLLICNRKHPVRQMSDKCQYKIAALCNF